MATSAGMRIPRFRPGTVRDDEGAVYLGHNRLVGGGRKGIGKKEACTGAVTVAVPHGRKSTAVDDGRAFDATQTQP